MLLAVESLAPSDAGSMILHIRTGIVLVATTYSSPLKKGWTNVEIGLEYVLFSAVRRDPS